MKTKEIIKAYYEAFNKQNRQALLALVSENIVHDINQGERQTGKVAFGRFLDKMDTAYQEVLTEIVVMVDESERRAAAEFVVNGTYLRTDPGLPEAKGQKYVIPAGAFIEVDPEAQLITRISTYYNLPQWIKAVSQ